MILYQRKNRKLSYGRGQGPTVLPAGCVRGGGGPALEAAWFAVPVRCVSVEGPQIAQALVVATGNRMPVSDRSPDGLTGLSVQPQLGSLNDNVGMPSSWGVGVPLSCALHLRYLQRSCYGFPCYRQ